MLFALFIKEFGDDLVASGKGVRVGSVIIPGLFFADDIVLFADSETDLQTLLDITGRFANRYDILFSNTKSKILHNFRASSSKRWKLGNTSFTEAERYALSIQVGEEGERDSHIHIEIQEQGDYKYLGMELSTQGKARQSVP